MKTAAAILGVALILLVLAETFETIILPRRITRPFRLTRLFYRYTWRAWISLAQLLTKSKRRESLLSVYGPLSLPLLLACYAVALIFGFSVLYYAWGQRFTAPDSHLTFGSYLYLSGTTFFTLGLGDITPLSSAGRTLTVIEAGVGFGYLASVISYLPVLYQSFSNREIGISLLDARAGSPPRAVELLRRHASDDGQEALRQLLADFERWSASLMESHLSYPVLCYFRSQHDNQSWLSALTAILDASAVTLASGGGECTRQARLTFAMARHAVVDIAQVFRTAPLQVPSDRLPASDFVRLRSALEAAGISFLSHELAEARLAEFRGMYEPYVQSLALHLAMPIPSWMAPLRRSDNWQTSAWGRISGLTVAVESEVDDGH